MLLAISGFAWMVAQLFTRTTNRMEPEGMLALLYMNIVFLVGAAFRAVSPWTLIILVVSMPVVLLIHDVMRTRSDQEQERKALNAELEKARAFLRENPADDFPYRQIAEVYQRVGENALSAQYFNRAASCLTRDAYRADDLRRHARAIVEGRPARGTPQTPSARELCACLSCGDIQPRQSPSCGSCGAANYPAGLRGVLWRIRELLEGDIVVSIAKAAALSLVFVPLGWTPHHILWVVWSVALWLGRTSMKESP